MTRQRTIARHMLRLLSAMVACVVPISILIAFVLAAPVDRTMENNRRIVSSFKRIAQHVDQVRTSTGRFPAQTELDEWLQNSRVEMTGSYWISEDPELAAERRTDLVEVLGAPPKGTYLLHYWRGEWIEYYAPWSGKTTVPSDESAYYFTGFWYLDLLVLLTPAVLLTLIAVALWRWSNRFTVNPSQIAG